MLLLYVIYNFATGHDYETDVRATVQFGDSSTDPNMIAFSLLIPTSVCIQMIIENKNKVKKGLFWAALMYNTFQHYRYRIKRWSPRNRSHYYNIYPFLEKAY